MKKTILLFLIFISMVFLGYSQNCYTQAANKPSTYAPNFQNFINPIGKPATWDITKMKPQLAKVESWMKTTLKGFTGAKLMYGTYYFLDPRGTDFLYKSTGLKGNYQAIMMFFAYYCYENKNNIETEGESGSSLQVDINNVFTGDLCSDVGVFTINGKQAFRVLEKSSTEGRFDYYDLRKRMNFNDTVYTSKTDMFIIRNSDKPVFIPVTRKEYLQQLLKDVEANKTKDIASAKAEYTPAAEAVNKANFDEELKRIDNSKNYTPEQMAPYRKRFIETWETEKQKYDKRIAHAETESTRVKEVLLEYLKNPEEWLNSGFTSFFSDSYTEKWIKSYLDHLDIYKESKEDYTRSEVVSINPDYFNKALSMDVPQLILVTVNKNGYLYMYKLAEMIKKPGALTPLEAILTPGKQPIIQAPAESVSTYSLSYLPKLTKLPPLIVPTDMKPSIVAAMPVNYPPADKLNFELPAHSSKLGQLPQPLTPESYKTYVQQLNTSIADALKPDLKKKADDYVKTKNLTQSKDISNTAFAAWLQHVPTASLYLYSKALVANPSDALAANNFSAFLIMGGLPEKSIPMLEYWNKQKPGEATLLSNLGNAYYQLGDVDNAMKYLQECVQFDTLNPTANKILCLMYMKKGNTKKAEEHVTKSLTTSYDEQMVAILHELDNKAKPGEIMSRLPVEEFPMLKRIKLPEMPSKLDEMKQFEVELDAAKKSMSITIDDIEAKVPKINDDLSQKILMASLTKGISALRVKAQYIIIDGMQTYQRESISESDVFKYQLKKLAEPFNAKTKTISKNYAEKLNKFEGGEAGDEDEIATLELAKCKEINAEKAKYLAGLSVLVNEYAQRMEFISRKFYGEYAYWGPYWMPKTTISFPSIESAYLKDISGILSEYRIVNKSDCSVFEDLAKKDGKLQEWEDEFCASFKGNYAIGGASLVYDCNGWKMEGGEGILGEMGANYNDDGSFDSFTLGGGLGANWNVGSGGVAEIEAGASVKEFVKIGKDRSTGTWEVKDFGVKGKVSLEGKVLGVSAGDINVAEVSATVNAGVQVGGAVAPILNLN